MRARKIIKKRKYLSALRNLGIATYRFRYTMHAIGTRKIQV